MNTTIPVMDSFDKVRNAMRSLPGWLNGAHPDQIEGERLLALEKYAEAEAVLKRAAADIRSRSGARGGRLSKVLMALARAQWKLGKTAEAQSNLDTVDEMAASRKKPSSEQSECLDLRGAIKDQEGDAEGARALFKQALEVQEQVLPVDPAMLIERFRRLAAAHRKAGAGEEARTLMQRALETAEKRLGTSAPATADCLMDLGQCQFECGETETGIATMERAINIHRETLGATAEEVAKDLQVLAGCCHRAGALDEAVKYYELALHVRECQLGGDVEDFADLLLGLADVHTQKGDEAPAVARLQQAVGKLDGTGNIRLAEALESLGESYARWGRYDDAVSCYRKARNVWSKDPDRYGQALEANAVFLHEIEGALPPDATPSLDWRKQPEDEPEPAGQLAGDNLPYPSGQPFPAQWGASMLPPGRPLPGDPGFAGRHAGSPYAEAPALPEARPHGAASPAGSYSTPAPFGRIEQGGSSRLGGADSERLARFASPKPESRYSSLLHPGGQHTGVSRSSAQESNSGFTPLEPQAPSAASTPGAPTLLGGSSGDPLNDAAGGALAMGTLAQGNGLPGHASVMPASGTGDPLAYGEIQPATLKALPDSSALLWSGWDELSFDFMPLT